MDIESIKKVTLGPDDVVVVSGVGIIPENQVQRIKRNLGAAFPDNESLVLNASVSLDVVSPEFISKRAFDPEDMQRWIGDAILAMGCERLRGFKPEGRPLHKKPEAEADDPRVDVVGELLGAIKGLGPDRCLEGLTGMRRLHAAAAAVQQRRDEMPEPMTGHR